jgi:hypothetical protein
MTGQPPAWPASSILPTLGALPTAPATARGHIRGTLAAWRLGDLSYVVELVVSELAANWVNASTGPAGRPAYLGGRLPVIRVGLFTDGLVLVAEVWDQAGGVPVRKSADDADESGRGLDMVHQLTGARWGWHHAISGPGKCVWAECALEAPDCIPGSAGRNLEDIPGSMAYLASKGKGDRSMPLKRRPGPGIRDGVLQDPRNMSES